MTVLERLEQTLKSNHMQKQHEDWGYPRGWDVALDFVETEIGKLKAGPDKCPHGFSKPGYCSDSTSRPLATNATNAKDRNQSAPFGR